MRNLKKILALALVFAMAFTFTASAADFTDAAEIGAKYVDDVNMLVELGVIAGYPDGSFGPQKNITRAEFAKMAYTIKYGSDTDGNLFAAQKSAFSDVEGNANVAWAKGYINYCANQKIVSGVGNGKFNPGGNITVAEATKMLLVILGCDPAKEGFTGANWVANVTAKAIDLGIYNGWTGDPSVLATRELVAKLMRNTIFSSVYTYSAITGAGSQMDALGQDWNKTLGETTMGLQTVTGIVVANERYAIATNEEGTLLGDLNGDGDASDAGEADLSGVQPTGVDSGEAIVYYEAYNTYNKQTEAATMVVNRALDDDMLGAKVNIFFTADKIENSGRIDYKNIEVLGNVLVHSDTVAYTVPAIATKIMPDGDSTSTSTIRPYISFEVDGVEKQIKMSSDVAKYAKSTDAQLDRIASADIAEEVNKYAYVLDDYDIADDGSLAQLQGADTSFIAGMGAPSLAQYRFVSVDGGNTYSYMFKMVDDDVNDWNAAYGAVTAYSEAAGTIRIQGINGLSGSLDLGEEVVVNGEVAVDDVIIAYRANGKIVVEKVNAFTAAVESFTDNGVMLNGAEYFAWAGCAETANFNSIFEYYNEERGAMQANTTYYVYNNLILEIAADDVEVVTDSKYAVVLRSYYDADMDTAYVKLAFADNTEGTYKVGKLYTPKSSDLTNAANNLPQELANNSLFGVIVSYKLRDDGSVDLSGQDFEDIMGGDADAKTKIITSGGAGIVTKGKFNGKYGMNDSTVIFALYGNPGYVANGTETSVNAAGTAAYCENCNADAQGVPAGDQTPATGCYLNHASDVVSFAAVKAKAYKLADLKNLNANVIPNLLVGDYTSGGAYVSGSDRGGDVTGSYVLNSTKNANNYIVAAAVTVGANLASAGAAYDSDANIAYVVNARQFYNSDSDYYYAQFTLIDAEGLKTAYTIDDVQNDASQSMLDPDDGIGKLDGKRNDVNGSAVANWSSAFVRYEMNADGKISMIDTTDGEGMTYVVDNDGVDYTLGKADMGLYLVNLTGVRGDIVSFYDAYYEVNGGTSIKDVQSSNLSKAEDGCTVIAIDEDDYAGTGLTFVSSRTEFLPAENGGNAIIFVNEDGEIETIFSFSSNYKPAV